MENIRLFTEIKFTEKILKFTSIKEIYWSLWETKRKRLVNFWGEQANIYTLEYQFFSMILI